MTASFRFGLRHKKAPDPHERQELFKKRLRDAFRLLYYTANGGRIVGGGLERILTPKAVPGVPIYL